MAVGGSILLSFIAAIVFVIVNGLVLWLISSKVLNFRDQSTKTAFVVAGIAGVISFVLSLIPLFMTTATTSVVVLINVILFIINAVVLIYLLRRYYDLTWSHAILTWVIVLVIDLVLGFLVGMLLAFAAIGLGLGAV